MRFSVISCSSDASSSQGALKTEGGLGLVTFVSQEVTRAASASDALFYAFRAAVVGEFAGAEDGQGRAIMYTIDGHKCDPSFPSVQKLRGSHKPSRGELASSGFERHRRRSDSPT